MGGLYLQDNWKPYTYAVCGSALVEIDDLPFCPECDTERIRERLGAIRRSEQEAAESGGF